MMKQKVTITLNEVADLLSKDSEQGTSGWSIGQMIGRIAKQYRTASLYLLMDTQLPSELPDIKETMKRVYVYNSSLPSVQRAMAIAGISEYAGDMNNDDYAIIPRLSPGWYYLFDRDKGVSIHKLMYIRSRTYQAGEDFYDIYDKVYGKTSYQNIVPLIDEINAEKERSENDWQYKKKLFSVDKPKKKKKREEDDEEDEEETEETEEKEFEEKVVSIKRKEPKEEIIEEPKEEPTPDSTNWGAYSRTVNIKKRK